MTHVTYVYITRVNAHDPNEFQHSLFAARIKLFAVNSICHRLALKALFCVSTQKHDISMLVTSGSNVLYLPHTRKGCILAYPKDKGLYIIDNATNSVAVDMESRAAC